MVTGGPEGGLALPSRPPGSLRLQPPGPHLLPLSFNLLTNQALIYTIYASSHCDYWECAECPSPPPALHVSQSMVVVEVPSHRARPPVGSLPCGGSDHSAVLTTRDLAPQPTVIEVTSQAIP